MKKGDKVHYQPEHYGKHYENGIVKEVRTSGAVFVVYHCANNWDEYEEYTAARTEPDDLKIGWKECGE